MIIEGKNNVINLCFSYYVISAHRRLSLKSCHKCGSLETSKSRSLGTLASRAFLSMLVSPEAGGSYRWMF